MAKRTKLQDRIAQYLTKEKGFQEISNNSKEYRIFKMAEKGKNFIFLNKNGAVYTGPAVYNSVSVTRMVQQDMRAWEEREK